MKQLLVYGDSLSWGIVPDTRQRHPFEVRWPGRMERLLAGRGREVRVIEDCLNGRRTVWEDPFKPGRRGLDGLGQRIEVNSPLALVILALGTNDFQSMHPHNAWHAAQGVAALVDAIRNAPIEPGMPLPPILVMGCALFDAGDVVTASAVDGVHLDAEAHLALGDALADIVEALVWPE